MSVHTYTYVSHKRDLTFIQMSLSKNFQRKNFLPNFCKKNGFHKKRFIILLSTLLYIILCIYVCIVIYKF